MALSMETGRITSFEDISRVPIPEPTRSYTPVANAVLVSLIRASITGLYGHDAIASEEFGLSCNDQQMFGVINLKKSTRLSDYGDINSSAVSSISDMGALSIGFRNSYNKTLAAAVAAGMYMFVCDNKCFHTDGVKEVRKHTRFIMDDLEGLVQSCVAHADESRVKISSDLETLASVRCLQDDGYRILGLALGLKILKAQQATIAYREWDAPSHTEFEPRTLFSLYNCVTESLKRGQAGSALERHCDAHRFFQGIQHQVTSVSDTHRSDVIASLA